MSLHIVTGCMFSGKASELLRRFRLCEDTKLVVNHVIDTRYDECGRVTSHDSHSEDSFAVATLNKLRSSSSYQTVSHIFIDEGQFFDDLLEEVIAMVDGENKHVTVAGLNGDFARCTFGKLHELLPHADSITLLKARCVRCEKSAMFTHKVKQGGEKIHVSVLDYIPLCRNHYLNESANTMLSQKV